MKNLIFYKKGRPVIAIPIDGSLKVACRSIDCFPSYTMIRKIFKCYLYLNIFIRFIFRGRFVSEDNNKIDKILVEWFDLIKRKLDNTKLYPVYIWSLVDGRERYYVHLLDEKGVRTYFGKITTKKDDYELLEKEKEKLFLYKNMKEFNVPQVISFEKNDSYCSLVVSYLDKGYKLYHPEKNPFPLKVVTALQNKIDSIDLSQIYSMKWFDHDLKSDSSCKHLLAYIMSYDDREIIKTCTIHGDFGSENIFINDNSEFYIIDWERSFEKAPYLTDEVAFWLGAHHKIIKQNEKSALKLFNLNFQNREDKDLVLALLYLISVNFNLAIFLGRSWKIKRENYENIL